MDHENNQQFPQEQSLNNTLPCHDCEEEAICNCENNEQIIPYYADDKAEQKNDACQKAEKKCEKVKKACCKAADRLMDDWKKADGAPYVKYTSVCRMDLYKTPCDEKPIDSFSKEMVHGFSMRKSTLLCVGVMALISVGCLIKKIIK